MKKITALILTVVMIAAALPFAAFAGRFTDVADGKWYSEAISFCAANGYMDGVGEGVFDRTSNLSRSMFVTILAKIDGVDLSAYEGRTLFTDVNTGRWYSAAITWAAENGYASGIGEGVFGYKNDTTREQIALFFYTYASLNGIDVSARANIAGYTDANRIHDWARDAVQWAVASGLISGTTETTLNPRGVCTRAEAAVMIRAFVLGFLTDCEHAWVDATCTEMGYCTNCSLKSGTELGHDKGNAICTASVPCTRCGATVPATEHTANAATCTAASICSVCGTQVAPAKGHNYTVATCTAASVCLNCGHVSGNALGHTTTNGVCGRCGAEVFANAHSKLIYYITANGETFTDGDKGFYDIVESNGVEFETFVYMTPGTQTVYLLEQAYESSSGIYFCAEIELNSTSGIYNIYGYAYDAEYDYYDLTGGIYASQLNTSGAFTLYGCNSSDADREDAIGMTQTLLPFIAARANLMLDAYANGLSLSAYGFNMNNLQY